jgi:hypothetical protein
MNEIIIVADLGHLKAFRMTRNPLGLESPKIELIKSCAFIEAHAKSSDKFSDSAGRYYVGSGKKGTGAGFGEPHHIESEAEKRLIAQFAEDIKALILKEGCEKWYFAADSGINGRIIEKLDSSIKAKLKKNITANLTKATKSKILSRFA